MKATPTQIAKFEELIDGYKKNDSPIDFHLEALSELIDYFLEELSLRNHVEECANNLGENLSRLWLIKRDLLDLVKIE